ncbi:hypothetical protein G3I60_05285 [Streptomyces sp. SID13666]|nr:hypothetical protein [Streptomyces sp. SID13666]
MAGELDALVSDPPARRGSTCTVGRILAGADESTAAALQRILDTPTVTARQIADALTKHGHAVSMGVIIRHRRRGAETGCLCPR